MGGSLAGRPLTGLVDPRRTLALFEDGATIVFQGLQRSWPTLRDLAAELEADLGHPVQVNAYLTPPASQGFAVHADTHDVFVVQTHGQKRWELHDADLEGSGGADVESVLLEPGTSLYLPTGTRHSARAQDDVSLHITIGVNQRTWRELLTRTVGALVAELPDGHLPAGLVEDPQALQAGLAERLHALADGLAGLDPAEVAEQEAVRFGSRRPPRLQGAFVDTARIADIDSDTVLVRRPGHLCELVDAGDRVRLLLGDRVISMPGWVRPALEEIRSRERFAPADLADHLDAESSLVLCRRLVREGLLRIGP